MKAFRVKFQLRHDDTPYYETVSKGWTADVTHARIYLSPVQVRYAIRRINNFEKRPLQIELVDILLVGELSEEQFNEDFQ